MADDDPVERSPRQHEDCRQHRRPAGIPKRDPVLILPEGFEQICFGCPQVDAGFSH